MQRAHGCLLQVKPGRSSVQQNSSKIPLHQGAIVLSHVSTQSKTRTSLALESPLREWQVWITLVQQRYVRPCLTLTPLTILDLDPVPPAQRTWGAVDYWAYVGAQRR